MGAHRAVCRLVRATRRFGGSAQKPYDTDEDSDTGRLTDDEDGDCGPVEHWQAPVQESCPCLVRWVGFSLVKSSSGPDARRVAPRPGSDANWCLVSSDEVPEGTPLT